MKSETQIEKKFPENFDSSSTCETIGTKIKCGPKNCNWKKIF